jgi:hypothetical protein
MVFRNVSCKGETLVEMAQGRNKWGGFGISHDEDSHFAATMLVSLLSLLKNLLV